MHEASETLTINQMPLWCFLAGYEALMKADGSLELSNKRAIDNRDRWFSLSSVTGDVSSARRTPQQQ